MTDNNMLMESGDRDANVPSMMQSEGRDSRSNAAAPIMDASYAEGMMTPQVLMLMIRAGLKRSWKWALFLGIVLSVLSAGMTYYLFPVRYEAIAWVQVQSVNPSLVFGDNKTEVYNRQEVYDTLVGTQFELIKSPRILTEVLTSREIGQIPQLQKARDKVDWLRKNIILTQRPKSEYFTISCKNESSLVALAVVKTVLDKYFTYYEAHLATQESTNFQRLQHERTRRSEEVRRLQKELRDLMKSIAEKGGDMDSLSASMFAGLSRTGARQGTEESLRRDIYVAEAQLKALQAGLKATRNINADEIPIQDIVIRDAIMQDEWYRRLLGASRYIKTMIDSQGKIVQKDDTSIQRLEDQRREIEEEAETLYQDLAAEKRQELVDRYKVRLAEDILDKETRVQSQELLIAELQKQLEKQTEEVRDRTDEIARMMFMQWELDREIRVLNMLSEKVVAMETERNAPTRITRADEPTLPTEPNTQLRLPLAGMAGMGMFFFPFLLGIGLEMLRPRLYHVSQIRRAIPGIAIGEIMEPPVAWIHGMAFRKRLARYRESIHNWCTHLILAERFKDCQTMAIASVAGDDGKTFMAIQIGTAMAQMKGGPVLLIDGDMRVGRLHTLFGNEEPGMGLADVLSFQCGIGEALVMDDRETNLHLLSAGNLVSSPYELLGDGRFRELLGTLSVHYAMILVVLPPVANAAESLIMANSVDSVILCVRQSQTVLSAMEDVYRKLVHTGSRVDGIVVKDIPYNQMSGHSGGFSEKVEQIRLAHLLQQSEM
ncbi:MAG: polysaccharide biosynthesis tyrosine autokinase [Thermoguttaceae bacterium]